MPQKSWWARLPFGMRMTLCALAVLVPLTGGLVAVNALVSDSQAVTSSGDPAPAPTGDPAAGMPAASTGLGGVALGASPVTVTPESAAATGQAGADATPTAVAGGAPTADVEAITRYVTETESIKFQTRMVRDDSMPRGTYQERTPGQPGVRTLRYEVTTVDGKQTGKKLVSNAVTRQPVTRIIAVGTGRKDNDEDECNPNYSGCVPNADDVDCAGDGDGPAYIHESVKVTGQDVYALDGDNDGYGCN
jgi:hypothetical protein